VTLKLDDQHRRPLRVIYMDKSTRTILVTGATGKQGGSVARHLHNRGWKLRALTRDKSNPAVRELERMGIEIYEGDYEDRSSLDRAVEGVYGVFCVTTPFESVEIETAHGIAMAGAAYEAGVEHFVFSSVASANRDTGVPHFESKWKIEQHIRELGLRASVVRPVYLMDNLLFPSTHENILNGTLALGVDPEKPLQMIALDDIGRSIAMVFERPEKYLGKSFDIAGDELTMPEAAGILGTALDCNVEYEQLPIEPIRERNEDYGAMLQWFNDVGYNVDLEMMRVFYPGLHTFYDWVYETGWAYEECMAPGLDSETKTSSPE
jgi:uncharacterized protein YbjT (DUF2867 family)